jgi:hypothetical protein
MRTKKLFTLSLLLLFSQLLQAQFLMDMVDTSNTIGKGILSVYKKFDNIRIGGYIQPQFQFATEKGVSSFEGGDFATNINNRFMLRRGRIRFDYLHLSDNNGPSVQVVFQFDGTEKGVFIRDFWGRIFENRYKNFSLTAGMFARPFGFETNLSSSDRESPERGRMNQLLMKSERDLGAMVSFDSRNKAHRLKYLKIDAGFFNGQGLAATADFDSRKDFIARIALKPYSINKKLTFSAAASYLNGGFIQNTNYRYHLTEINAGKSFVVDSAGINEGAILPRKYYGADMQLKIKNKGGITELRAEFITGTQTATINSSETPPALLQAREGYYVRNFTGGYLYLLHHFINSPHQLGVKLDWYDPNTKVAGMDIGKPGTALGAADIKYTTLGFGYINYISENIKLVVWYVKVVDEKTQMLEFANNVKEDVFTCRMQFRF